MTKNTSFVLLKFVIFFFIFFFALLPISTFWNRSNVCIINVYHQIFKLYFSLLNFCIMRLTSLSHLRLCSLQRKYEIKYDIFAINNTPLKYSLLFDCDGGAETKSRAICKRERERESKSKMEIFGISIIYLFVPQKCLKQFQHVCHRRGGSKSRWQNLMNRALKYYCNYTNTYTCELGRLSFISTFVFINSQRFRY